MAPLKLRSLTKCSKMSGFFPNPLAAVYKKTTKSFLGHTFNVEWHVHLIYISIKSGKNKS